MTQPSAPRETAKPIRYGEIAPWAPEGRVDLQGLATAGLDIEIEIGFGRGMFLLERLEAAPGSFVFGLEVKTKLAHQVHQRLARMTDARARVWADDVRELLPRCGPDGCVARVFMHFPDPWWKERHAKRRLMDTPLYDQLARLVRPGGEVFIQTDVQERAEAFQQCIREHAAFDLGPNEGWIDENPYGARSNREKRAIADGLPIFRLLAHRR